MASGDVHNRHIYDVPGRITELGLRCSNAVMVEPKAVAMALAGQGKTRGTVALTHIPVCTNQSVALIKPDADKLDPHFLYQSLLIRYEEMRSRSAGGGRAGLTKAIIEAVPVQLPSPSEQRKIARILTTLDNLTEKTEALITKYQAIKRGMMHDLFTRGVDAYGHLRPTPAEAPDLYKHSALGWIPREWECMSFGTYILSGPQNGLYKPLSAYSDDGFPIVRIDGFYDGALCDSNTFRRLKLTSTELALYCIAEDDILVNRVNSIDFVGKSAIVNHLAEPTVYESNIMRLRVDGRQLNPHFAIRLLCLPIAQKQLRRCAKSAIAQASINQSDIRGCLLPVPPVIEQGEIIERCASIESDIESERKLLTKLHLQKVGLMQDLLTGKVRVTVDDSEESVQ